MIQKEEDFGLPAFQVVTSIIIIPRLFNCPAMESTAEGFTLTVSVSLRLVVVDPSEVSSTNFLKKSDVKINCIS